MKRKLFDPRVLLAFFFLMIFIIPVVIMNLLKNPSTPKTVIITGPPANLTSTFAITQSTDIAVTQTEVFTATTSMLMTQTNTATSANTSTVTSTVLSRTVPSVPVVSSTTSPLQEVPITNTVSPTITETPTSTTSSMQISLIQSFPAPGSQAEGITWDGTFLWLTDNSGSIFKMSSSGTVSGNFASPEVTPQGIAWDGTSFWVFTTNRFFIYRFQIVEVNTQTISSFRSPATVAGGGITQDMAWDGGGLWYANQFNVYKLDTSGSILSSFTLPKNVAGLDWDGSNLWLAYNDFPNNATLIKVSTTGETLKSYPSPIFEVMGLAWADDYLWALGIDSIGGSPMIYKLSVSN